MTEAPEFKISRGRRSHQLWQELVDNAHALLAIDSAKQSRQVTGGPNINNARCQQLLEDGAKRGIHPNPDAIERFLAAYCQDNSG